MNKTLTIASREFFHNLGRPAFLFAVLGLPTIILLADASEAFRVAADRSAGAIKVTLEP